MSKANGLLIVATLSHQCLSIIVSWVCSGNLRALDSHVPFPHCRGVVQSSAGTVALGTHTVPIGHDKDSPSAWVWHDGTAHVVLASDATSLTIRNAPDTIGNWADIGIENGTVTHGVFAAHVT